MYRNTNSLGFVVSMLRPFRGYIIALSLILLIYSGNVFWRTHLIKNIVDTATHVSNPLNGLWSLAGYFGVALLIEFLTFRLQEWCTVRYEPVLQNYVTSSVFQHVLQREYRFFQSTLSGSLTAKINDLTTSIPTIVNLFLYDYFVNSLLVLVAFITLWEVGNWFAFSIVLWSLLTILTSALISKRASNLASHTAETGSQIAGHITDVFNNVIISRLFSTQHHDLKDLKKLQAVYHRSRRGYLWLMLKFLSLQGVSFQVYQIICVLFLIHMYGQNVVTAGDFAMILSTNALVTASLWKMFERIQEVNMLWGKINQAVSVLLAPPCIQDKPDAVPLIVKSGTIQFENVTFSHSQTSKLFDRQTVYIKARQKVGLVGYSGSGKTTFINLIARLFDVDDGSIMIDGQDIRNVTQETLHKAITIVPQENNLFNSTILENIRYGNPDSDDSEIIACAKKAYAHAFIIKLPHQYETPVGERGLNLSGGQRQLIAIARAFLKNAPIVLLDEVTAHLDVHTGRQIHTSLAALVHDKITLIVSHHLDTLMTMDRILVFKNGGIIEDGTHQQLLAKGGHYTKLWTANHRNLSTN